MNRLHVVTLLKLRTSKQITDFQWDNHLMQKWVDGIITMQSRQIYPFSPPLKKRKLKKTKNEIKLKIKRN